MITIAGRSIKSPSSLTRLVFFILLSILFMYLDSSGHYLKRIRAGIALLTEPIHVVAEIPVGIVGWFSELFQSDENIRENYSLLQKQNLDLQVRMLRYQALEAENKRLRILLNSSRNINNRVIVAELMKVSLEPYTRKIYLNRGSRDKVYLKQPVIDAYGILGQITKVYDKKSVATLITDPSHAIPVMIKRNGLRTIAYGTGRHNRMRLPHLTASANIRQGDLLISSGMGGTFPPGYPVASVTKIINNPDEGFLLITAKPLARVNYNKEVLLLWPGTKPKTGKTQ